MRRVLVLLTFHRRMVATGKAISKKSVLAGGLPRYTVLREEQRRMFIVKFCILAAFALSLVCAQSINIVNPDFSAVSVQCSEGYAYQATQGGSCTGSIIEQDFNSAPGIGWTFLPPTSGSLGEDGITIPNTTFNPPPFTGLPFSQAAFLQGPRSVISQKIEGFLSGRYQLSFYLGSRYGRGTANGTQTVLVTLDNQLIGVWPLQSFTPFTLQKAFFNASSGPHILAFRGAVANASTAFLSGVSIASAP